MKEEFAGSKAKGRRWGLGGRGAEMGVVGRGWGCLNAFLCIAPPPRRRSPGCRPRWLR